MAGEKRMNKHLKRLLTGCGVLGSVVAGVAVIVYVATHRGAAFDVLYGALIALLIYVIGFAWERE